MNPRKGPNFWTGWWPWMIAGAFGGALIARATWANSSGDEHRDGVWRPGMSRSQFETCLRLSRIPSAPPVFRDLVIYPRAADGSVYVAGEYLPDLAKAGRYRAFELRLPPADADVRADIESKFPRVSFRYAWWASPWLTAALGFSGSVIVIGLGFPLVLRRILPGGHSLRVVEAPPCGMEARPVASAEVELPASDELSPDPAPVHAVPTLDANPLPPVSPPAEDAIKDYRGEYYPVARPVGPSNASA
jgi:hypothetical protein